MHSTRFVVALLLAGCNGVSAEAPPPVAASPPRAIVAPAETPTVAERRIEAADLRRHIEHLASDAMAGRPTPSTQLDAAAAYIATQFQSAGLNSLPGLDGYRQRFNCGKTNAESANVIGTLEGSTPDTADALIVSAHYDHVGIRAPVRGKDSIYNGANDNASGVAAMIEIAEYLASRKDPLPRPVVFVAFCGEELGLRGSRHYVSDPPWPLERTVAVVNLEMLGRPDPADPPRAWITGMPLSDLGESFATVHPGRVEFVASQTVGPLEAGTFTRSDNYPFAQAGIVAHTIAAGHLDELYHSADDEAETMDFDRMAIIVEAIAAGVESLASADARPDWTEAGRAEGLGR